MINIENRIKQNSLNNGCNRGTNKIVIELWWGRAITIEALTILRWRNVLVKSSIRNREIVAIKWIISQREAV